MSDNEEEPLAHAPSLQSRRLRLRHSLMNASQLPSAVPSPYCHRPHISSTGGIPARHRRDLDLGDNDPDWESEDALSPGDEIDENEGGILPRGRRHRSGVSTSSLLSSASTLVNSLPALGNGGGRHYNGRMSRTPSREAREPSTSPQATQHLFAPQSVHRVPSREGVRKEARYIEYLERQVSDLMTQLQSYTSPTSTTSHAAKLRKLSTENQTLRQEIGEWEMKFSLRVNEEVAGKTTIKSLRVELLETELKLEKSEEQVRQNNMELRDLRKRCEDLQGVEEQNRSLGLRIEALSELLADSTRTQCPPSAPMSRSASVTVPRRISSMASIDSQESNQSSKSAPEDNRMSSRESTAGMSDYGISDHGSMIHSYDEQYSPVGSTRSSPRLSHVPMSFAPGIPSDPNSVRSRRMRRFPPGSTAPKTFILPSAAAILSPTMPYSANSLFSHSGAPSTSGTRPGSSSSALSGYEQIQNNCHPSGNNMASLFAELARVQDDRMSNFDTMSQASTANTQDDVRSEAQGSTYSRSSHLYAQRSPSPTPSDTSFNLFSETLTNPTPMILKVIGSVEAGLNAPSLTFNSARRRALSMLGRVVGRGVDRVSQNRVRILTAKSRRRISAPVQFSPPPTLRARRSQRNIGAAMNKCKECGAPKALAITTARLSRENTVLTPRGGHRKSIFDLYGDDSRRGDITPTQSRPGSRSLMLGKQGQAIDATLDNLWLWVRFVIAVVVALGMAVKDGPAIAMNDDSEGIDHVREEERERALKRLERSARGEFWIDE